MLLRAITYLRKNDPRRSWDDYFMQIAEIVATRSKDPSTQVGAVVVIDRRVVATGYNGFPRGVNDAIPERYDRPTKYLWTAHAEENCVLQGARYGTAMLNATLYVTPLSPCTKCALAIVGAGIKEVVVPVEMARNALTRWGEDLERAAEIMSAARVLVRSPE